MAKEAMNDFEKAAEDVAAYYAEHPEAEAGRETAENPGRREFQTLTIKFAKGLVGDPFMSKNGKELVEIMIPNSDPADKRPWQTFVLAARDVHEDKFGKGMWAKIPAEGHTTVRRQTRTNPDAEGPAAWNSEKTLVTNADLKKMVEFYKERPRESVKEKLEQKKEESSKEAKPPAAKTKAKSSKSKAPER